MKKHYRKEMLERKKEHIILSYILSLSLLSFLLISWLSIWTYNLIIFQYILLLVFLLIIGLIFRFLQYRVSLLYPSKTSYIVYVTTVTIITLLLYNNVSFNSDLLKVFHFIPVILFTANFGRPFSFFAAGFSSLNLFFINLLQNNFNNLDIDIIILVLFFWIAWLISGYIEIENKARESLEKSLISISKLVRKLNESNKELKESQKLIKLNFDQSNLGMAISDLSGRFMKTNNSLAKLFGFDQENELIGRSFTDFVIAKGRNKMEKIYQEMVDSHLNTASFEQEFSNNNQGIVWLNCNLTLVRDEEGLPLYFLYQLENITDQKMAEEKLRKQKELLEYNQLKSNFFAKLSHELKTPLNLIFSALQIIELHNKKHGSNDYQRGMDRYTGLIKQNSYRLLRLVNNIIDLTKIDANSFEVYFSNHDIVAIVREITLSTKEYIINNGKKLGFNTGIGKKFIACDPFSIERILLNLISNAVKFTNEGDTITVKVKERYEKVLITVEDTGIGISEEDINMIFEQFRQVDESFTRRAEGSGIGLSIVKSLVELHNGHIWVESEYGQGSTFFIELPIRTIEKKPNKPNYTPDNLVDKIDIEFSDIYSVN